jgi:hypothetical protein
MSFQKQTGGGGEVVRNKIHLIAQGFSQVKGLDFGKIFDVVAHLGAIRILLVFVVSKFGLKTSGDGFRWFDLKTSGDGFSRFGLKTGGVFLG